MQLNLSLKGLARVEVPDSYPGVVGSAASKFRPKLHSRARSLSLESLAMSRAVGCRDSLDIPKICRESLDTPKICRESLDIPKICRESLDMPKICRESLE